MFIYVVRDPYGCSSNKRYKTDTTTSRESCYRLYLDRCADYGICEDPNNRWALPLAIDGNGNLVTQRFPDEIPHSDSVEGSQGCMKVLVESSASLFHSVIGLRIKFCSEINSNATEPAETLHICNCRYTNVCMIVVTLRIAVTSYYVMFFRCCYPVGDGTNMYKLNIYSVEKLQQCLELAANSDGKLTKRNFEISCRDLLIGHAEGMLLSAADAATIPMGWSVLDCVHTRTGILVASPA